MGGRRRLIVTSGVLVEFFAGRSPAVVINNSLPFDFTIVGVKYDPFRDTVELLLESEAFPPTPEGSEYPELRPPTLASARTLPGPDSMN
jgi:hypothetical protein